MKHHVLGVYPMYFTEKDFVIKENIVQQLEITCAHIDKISVGDTYEHKHKDNRFVVSEIKEERQAKGDHKKPATFYRLVLKK